MKIKTKMKVQKIPTSQLIFFVAYTLYLIFALLSTSFYYKYFEGRVYIALKVLCLYLIFISEIIKCQKNIKEFWGLAICSMMCGVVIYNTSLFNDIVLLIAFVYCGRDIAFEKIAKLTEYVSSVMLIAIILSAYVGIIQNYTELFDGRYREYLGFRYALYPAAIIFNITALILYKKRKKLKIHDILILLLSNSFIFYKTNSRLSFYMSVVMILCMFLFQIFPSILEKSKILHVGMTLSFVISCVGSIMMTVKFSDSINWMYTINDFLNNRLKFGKRSLILYGVSFWGKHNMEWIGNGLDSAGNKSTKTYLWVDNCYISIMQRFGIIVMIIVVLLLTYTLIKCLKNKNYYLMFMLTFIAGHCIVDDLFLYLHYNTFWFLIGSVLMERNKYSKSRKSYIKYQNNRISSNFNKNFGKAV